jgi:hypothetical protein
MSYILDALKKAERDRLREDPQELDDFASANWDPYQQTSSSISVKYLLLLAVTLVILVALVIYSGSFKIQSPITAVDEPASSVTSQLDQISNPIVQPKMASEPEPIAPKPAPSVPLPDLVISGHMYISEGSSSNRLFAGNRSFRQGDSLDDNWVIESIGLEGLEIRSGERLETLPYR